LLLGLLALVAGSAGALVSWVGSGAPGAPGSEPGAGLGELGELAVSASAANGAEQAGAELAAMPAVPAVSARPPGGIAARPPEPTFTYDPVFTERVEGVLRRGRVSLGHVIAMDPKTGKLLASVSTDSERFPVTRTYPAASLIKVVTAAAALDRDPAVKRRTCRYVGSPWRLTRKRVDPPRRGNETTFRKALAISNNQCFAQIAVHTLGTQAMLDAIDRFGVLDEPAPGYAAGSVDPGSDAYALGKLGSGLAGTRITPLHAVQLAAVLADGLLLEPRWVEGVPATRPPRRVLTEQLAAELRDLLVTTTARGTARSAFRDPRGRPLLGSIRVAGKTGSLSGRDPTGRYEWFIGLAPADGEAQIALATVVVQNDLWWRNASQISAMVLKKWFCPEHTCR
jgi:cell division protein FtsI/penicillin-binding protein 2